MKQQLRKNHRAVLMVLIAAISSVPANGASADPLSGGADPNLQSRIEQTSPGTAERLLNNLRENPPSAPSKKNLRPRSSRHQYNNTKLHAR
jgi:hypothetical protein